MATNASVTVGYQKIVDGVKAENLSAALVTISDAALVRADVTIGSAASETDYLPAGISQVDFLLVTSKDNDVKLRTVSAGTQYTIPGGGVFLIQKSVAGVDAILLTGNGSTDAKVTVIVGQTS